MTVQEIMPLLEPYRGKILVGVVVLLTYLIDISKIHLNPWKWVGKLCRKLLKDLGSVLTEDVKKEFTSFQEQYADSVSTHINSYLQMKNSIDAINTSIESLHKANVALEYKLDNHVAESMRRDILDFQNACLNKRRHTKEEFTYIYRLCDKYEAYVKENHLENSEAEEAIRYIKQVYRNDLENGTFIIKDA